MVTPLRIVFFGTPRFAVPSLDALRDSRHPVVAVVTQPDRPRGRGQKVLHAPVKETALAAGIPILQPSRLGDPDVAVALARLQADLGVVAAYGKLIPPGLLALPRLGMINVHASLLPKYRGAAPVHRAVLAGETVTGVTIMRVIEALDAGGMFAKTERSIGPHDTSETVERDLAAVGATLLLSVVEALAAGTAHAEPQDDAQATYAPRLVKGEGLITWTADARAIHNLVRGLHPWPHAHTAIHDRRTIIRRTRLQESGPPGAPGTVLRADHDGIQVATGAGESILIEELQPEGRRPMSAREFLAGHPVAPGTVLGHP